MSTLKRRTGTATLILTPQLIHRFGATFHTEPTLASVKDLYQETIRKAFQPVTASTSVAHFEVEAQKAIPLYSGQYDKILREYVDILGESRFRIEFIKQITDLGRELANLPFTGLNELFQKHVAYCTNAATNEEELFKSYKLNVVEQLLRTDNFYFTLLVLLLDGTLAGPQWIMLESYHRTLKAQTELKRILALYAKTGQLAGSLVFVEGSIDPIPDTWKHR